MATFKAIVFPGKQHLKQDGTTNIKIRIYHNSVPLYIPTEYYVKPDYMGSDGSISVLADVADYLNFEIGSQIQLYRQICIKLGSDRTKKMSCSELKEQILKIADPSSEFIDFVGFSKEIISKTVKSKTAEWYETSLKVFIKFYQSDKIDAKDIKTSTLERFIEYLKNQKVVIQKGDEARKIPQIEKFIEPGTINNYLRGLRVLYNKAKDHFNNYDYDIIQISGDPFAKIIIPQYVRKRKNLTIDQIIRIRDTVFERERTNMARDVFMILFYFMGTNIKDFFCLTKESYGRINFTRNKVTTVDNNNTIPLSIRIEPEARELLNRYSNGCFISYFKTKYGNHKQFMKAVNQELKIISEELHLGVPLSSNWARHSWASIARNKAGINKADIDFCLGHVNNDYKMADIYIEIDYTVCDRANRAVLDLLKKNNEKK